MKRTPVSTALGISYPVLQAGMPWVSNPELVAAVSNAGGLGVLHPTSGVEPGGDPVADLHAVVRRVQRLTQKPFGVSFHLPHPQIEQLIEAAAQEGINIAITYGGSPALFATCLIPPTHLDLDRETGPPPSPPSYEMTPQPDNAGAFLSVLYLVKRMGRRAPPRLHQLKILRYHTPRSRHCGQILGPRVTIQS